MTDASLHSTVINSQLSYVKIIHKDCTTPALIKWCTFIHQFSTAINDELSPPSMKLGLYSKIQLIKQVPLVVQTFTACNLPASVSCWSEDQIHWIHMGYSTPVVQICASPVPGHGRSKDQTAFCATSWAVRFRNNNHIK